jgi:hypothetical protein
MQQSNLFQTFYRILGSLFIFIGVGLYFDSTHFIAMDENGQWYANLLMLAVFAYLFYKATDRSRELMINAVLIGILGECLFSLGFDMYTYRLENVPVYVPPGHAIIYIVTVYFCRDKYVKKHKTNLEKWLSICVFLYAFCFLILRSDVFGFILTLLTLYLLKNKPRERLFYYSMYAVVAVLEIIGTTYKCWYWPDSAFGIFKLIKSANPPSGISFFYFGLDLGSLWLYKQRHKIAWTRMKRIRNKEFEIIGKN